MRELIVLLSDFGESEHVGIMKGVILSHAPDARILDLTHSISPQSVREAGWVLLQSFESFPPGTTFLCVVDPGVGTGRDAVFVETSNYSFIGPDNGLLFPAAKKDGIRHVFSLVVDSTASRTFHGRDVFAKAAGALKSGNLESVLQAEKMRLNVDLEFFLQGQQGEVVRIDHFGNLVTNIPPLVKSRLHLRISNLDRTVVQCSTYAEGPEDDIFAIVGSAGTFEISAKNARATDIVSASIGDRIILE
ncbi:MAG: hypothetical protein EAX95_05160 [Candidatus Thorarchaeota archaeon]|nr:hypothetical protein [Candidatus Thorarchaeota archaeon]